ncbi:hypothetical protein N058_01174 [Mycobacterium tuberculosis variant africanum MAL010100]|nr:hypothetical protein N058_01174 [Mycobacterium tuberculosis variant africanum MAL010100]
MTAVPHLTQSSDPKPREGTETFAKSPRPHRRSACRQTQNPERGRKRGWWASWRWGLSQVVRPKTPRGDGNLHPESPYARNASNVSSDPKPREGTETRNPAPHPQLRHAPEVVRPKTPRGDGNARNRPTWACPQRVVRPKTPRGDGNSITLFLSVARLRVSSDPKPREGTETRKRSTSLTILFSRRQTQNPERGRKRPVDGGCVVRASVVRPKTPRGDGNLHPLVADTADFRESSDPKPREGTETGNCVTARLAGRLSSDPKPREGTETPSDAGTEVDDKPSSDPKPREGTETSTPSVPHTGPVPCRQTQNPERGRKPDGTELSGFYQVVVRPKTPRGDGNPHGGTWTSATIGVVRPKTPRGDGNWTQNRTGCGRCSSRQTQNPERGRKRISPATPQPRYCSMSSDPKPREGTETHRR